MRDSAPRHLLASHATRKFIFGDQQCILRRQSSKQVERPGNDTGPSRLMAGPETSAIVSMELLVKQDVILPVRILLEDLAAAKDRTLSHHIAKEDTRKPAPDFLCNFKQRHAVTGASGAFDLKTVAVELV